MDRHCKCDLPPEDGVKYTKQLLHLTEVTLCSEAHFSHFWGGFWTFESGKQGFYIKRVTTGHQ